MRKILAIGGEALVGKDTFAAPLLEKNFKQLAFADNLKKMCMAVFGLSEFHVFTQQGKFKELNPQPVLNEANLQGILNWVKQTHNIDDRNVVITQLREKYILEYKRLNHKFLSFKTPRELLQFVGTEICRALSPDYHAEVLVYHLTKNPHQNYIITDARFPNEREMLKHMFGATLIRLKRPGKSPGLDSEGNNVETQGISGHASENSLGDDEDYDLVILNNGSIAGLQEQAEKLR